MGLSICDITHTWHGVYIYIYIYMRCLNSYLVRERERDWPHARRHYHKAILASSLIPEATVEFPDRKVRMPSTCSQILPAVPVKTSSHLFITWGAM